MNRSTPLPGQVKCGFETNSACPILDADGSSTIEAALIKLNKPLWNTAVEGFGNHDPGSGRYEQAKSDWDVIHEGRAWANKCNGKHAAKNTIISNIRLHLEKLGSSQ
jgi:hypothetical protein